MPIVRAGAVYTIAVPDHRRVHLRGAWVFVQLTDAAGHTGWGEASHSGDDDRVVALLRDRFLPALLDQEVPTVEAWLASLTLTALDRVTATALSAVEQALHDLLARHWGTPLARLWGGPLQSAVPLYANINRAAADRSPEGFAALARQAVAAGFPAVKCAPFDEVEPGLSAAALDRAIAQGLERVAAVRVAIGPDRELLVDCHSRFDRHTARRVIQALQVHRPFWVEDPLPVERDPEGLAWLRRETGQRLATGERLFGLGPYARLARLEAADVWLVDVKHGGGLWTARKVAALAEAYGVLLSPHNPSGPISTLASAHLLASTPSGWRLEYPFAEFPDRSALTTPPETLQGDRLILPTGYGLGADLMVDRLTLAAALRV